MTKIFTLVRGEVCRAWMDFHSIGHFIMGQICYVGSAIVATEMGLAFDMIHSYSLLFTLIMGVLFELIENGPCIKLKFDGRKDSVENSLADIVLVFLGGLFEFFLFAFTLYITNLVLNVSVLIVLIILYWKLRVLTC